ncbi:MAG: FecR domain-containing protein [Roseburia sp.]
MEKKKISGKVIGVAAVAAVAVCAIVVFLVLHFTKKDNTYRSIQIYELNGTTTIEREGIGEIDAVKNLYLESGDRVIVGADSTVRLKLDDDKYILVEENSILTIVAEGTATDSKTSIQLEQGAITNEIQNKLNDNSTYNITTPNSVMAVRGTIFRVEVYFDENGEVYTKVSTYEGTVASSLILPDGTRQEEILLVVGGKETIIHMNEEITEYLMELEDIDYSQTPLEVLEFLKEIVENGTELPGITLDHLEQLIQELSQEEPETETETESESETETETKAETEPESEQQKNYTVTFSYNGTVFGQQTVKEGGKATVPTLAPAETGAWDFDFSQEITGDVTIEWK